MALNLHNDAFANTLIQQVNAVCFALQEFNKDQKHEKICPPDKFNFIRGVNINKPLKASNKEISLPASLNPAWDSLLEQLL